MGVGTSHTLNDHYVSTLGEFFGPPLRAGITKIYVLRILLTPFCGLSFSSSQEVLS